jgi:hypothetical protein
MRGTLEELRAVRGELVVVGLDGQALPRPPTGVRVVAVRERDVLKLRLRGMHAASGSIVAIGEDHSVPAPGWCRAVVRAHAEHPSVPAIVGCLVNTANDSVSGRANFLAFAGLYVPPMPAVPEWRPPPLSTVSLKREALAALDEQPGALDGLVNRLYEERQMVADDRVIMQHDQDLGVIGSIRNAYSVTRAAYGYALDRGHPGRRYEAAQWAVCHLAPMVWRAGRAAQPPTPSRQAELAIVAALAAANATGAVLGSLAGIGRAPRYYE